MDPGTSAHQIGDEALAEAALAGDEGAESELDRRWRPRLVALARRVVSDRDLAEDAAQDALWRAFRNLDRFDRSRPFERWILAVAYRCAVDLARRRWARPLGGQDALNGLSSESRAGATENAASDEEMAALQQCMEGLTKRSRIVFGLMMSSFSLSEIGMVLGNSKSTVQSWLEKARAQLRLCLTDKGFGDGQ